MAKKRSTTRKPRATSSVQTTPQGNGIKKALLLIGLLVGGFAFGLKYLVDNAPEPQGDKAVTSHPKAEKSADKDQAPSSNETWRFIEDLPNKEVVVETYKIETKGPYALQCGSFRQQTQAEQLKATIAFSGYASDVRSKTTNNGTWHQVILGPFATKRDAEKSKHALRSNDINSCLIKPWA